MIMCEQQQANLKQMYNINYVYVYVLVYWYAQATDFKYLSIYTRVK